MTAAYRFEVQKLLATWRTRVLLLVCWSVPGLLVAAISSQGNLPADTVFGRWMATTGWAAPLVVLSFASTWVLPLLASVVAGDAFAVEDRIGTWRHLLVAVRSTRRVFAAKALAAATVVVLLAVGIAASSTAGGVLASGTGPLVALDGQSLAPGQAAGRVLLAWLLALAPTLAFAGLGLLGSVALGRSTTGLLLPVLLALALQLAQLLALPVAVRAGLPSWAFLTWRGLFTDPRQGVPIGIGLAVSLGWAALTVALAARLFGARDFTDASADGLGTRALQHAVLPLALLLAVSTAGVATASAPGIDRAGLERSLATAFGHLYRLQSHELHRPDVSEEELSATARCDKGGSLVDDRGPGNDWRCVVTWHLPGVAATGSAVYQLQVAADGRYVADGDGPQSVNGSFPVATPTGVAPNPLWQLDGFVDLISPP